MRLLCAFVLAAFVSLLPLALGGDRAEAGIVCGMFDGKFSCRSESRAGAQFGKNATPGARIELRQFTRRLTGEQAPTDPGGRLLGIPVKAPREERLMRHGLPTWHGRHATQLPLPEEFGIVGRQLRALHRVGVQQRTSLRRPPASLPGRRGEALLHNAPGRLEGLLLRDLRQILGSELSVSRRGSPPAGRCRTPRPTFRRDGRASGARRRLG